MVPASCFPKVRETLLKRFVFFFGQDPRWMKDLDCIFLSRGKDFGGDDGVSNFCFEWSLMGIV